VAAACQMVKPVIERVQALADISLSVLCCHSNETCALEGTPTILSSYIRVRAVVWECGEGQTDRHTDAQMAVATIYFASAMPHAKCNYVNTQVIHENSMRL